MPSRKMDWIRSRIRNAFPPRSADLFVVRAMLGSATWRICSSFIIDLVRQSTMRRAILLSNFSEISASHLFSDTESDARSLTQARSFRSTNKCSAWPQTKCDSIRV